MAPIGNASFDSIADQISGPGTLRRTRQDAAGARRRQRQAGATAAAARARASRSSSFRPGRASTTSTTRRSPSRRSFASSRTTGSAASDSAAARSTQRPATSTGCSTSPHQPRLTPLYLDPGAGHGRVDAAAAPIADARDDAATLSAPRAMRRGVVAVAASSSCRRATPRASRTRIPSTLVRPRVAPLSAMAQLGRVDLLRLDALRDWPTRRARAATARRMRTRRRSTSTDRATPRDSASCAPFRASATRIERPTSRSARSSATSDAPSPPAPPLPPGSASGQGRRWRQPRRRDGRARRPVLGRPREHAPGSGNGAALQRERDGQYVDVAVGARKLRRATYAPQFVTLFGVDIFAQPARLVDEAMFAVARFQIEDPSFHPYTSKYDYFLEGKARLHAERVARPAGVRRSEARQLRRMPPRSPARRRPTARLHRLRVRSTRRSARYGARTRGTDLGACGPLRTDLRDQPQYCGMFRTPSLRNTATRSEFFHNGVYRLARGRARVLQFSRYASRRIYPARSPAASQKFNDLPRAVSRQRRHERRAVQP